jgi:hypothetical protein
MAQAQGQRGSEAVSARPRTDELNSYEQKKKFHAQIRDIARQVEWAGEMMDEEDWKRLILAGAYGQDVVPSPFGNGFVVRNKRRTRDLEMPTMADLITQIDAFGAERNVVWSDPAWLAMMKEAEGRN